jgi:hypothetical protein
MTTRLPSSKLNLILAVAAAALSFIAWSAGAQVVVTNVQTVNVTPSGFSVVAAVSRSSLSSTSTVVSVYSDPGGVTNLAGQVGIEMYPLNSGDPTATNSYQGLLSRATLRQNSMGLGLVYARISSCAPGATYYYQIAVTDPDGQTTVWPTNGHLPSVTTALGNSFVLQSQQLLVTVSASYPSGSIITLATSNSASVLAAVVGDGAGKNQVFFSINDLIAAAGGTNYAPIGPEVFTASVFSQASNSVTQTYSLTFSNNFSVGQSSADTFGALVTAISIGSGAMLTGSNGAVPIFLNAQSAITGLSFVLSFPTNLFTAISVVPTNAVLGSASLSLLSSNTVRLSFTAAAGSSLQGNQQIAQLNLTAASNQPSRFVPLLPQTPAGTNADASVAANFSLQSGRAVIIGAQSLLDLDRAAGGLNLVLYGIPGDSYQIQSSTNLARAWSNYLLVPMTNLTQVFPNLDPVAAAGFFRAYSFNADPPILLQASLAGSQRSLLAYGIPGTNYTLLTSSNLSSPALWSPLLSYRLTNSFQFLTNLGNSSPAFYRLVR